MIGMEQKNKKKPQKPHVIELRLESSLLAQIKKFCEFINCPVDKFIAKELGDIMDLYKCSIQVETGVLERIFYDYFKARKCLK